MWASRLAQEVFPTYVGQQVFETVVRQAYLRFSEERGLPLVESWGRWEGLDRERKPLELDVVARLLDGGMMTGSAKTMKKTTMPKATYNVA